MSEEAVAAESVVESAEDSAVEGEEIDELDDMEFLLEEIENRIAPLA